MLDKEHMKFCDNELRFIVRGALESSEFYKNIIATNLESLGVYILKSYHAELWHVYHIKKYCCKSYPEKAELDTIQGDLRI